jgi:hypothetical protein
MHDHRLETDVSSKLLRRECGCEARHVVNLDKDILAMRAKRQARHQMTGLGGRAEVIIQQLGGHLNVGHSC